MGKEKVKEERGEKGKRAGSFFSAFKQNLS
jgi:hypothetical protein